MISLCSGPEVEFVSQLRDDFTIPIPEEKRFFGSLDTVEVEIKKLGDEIYKIEFETFLFERDGELVIPIPESLFLHFLVPIGINVGDEVEVRVCWVRSNRW